MIEGGLDISLDLTELYLRFIPPPLATQDAGWLRHHERLG